jgi:hypothetical protein
MFHRFDARLRRLEQQARETAWLHSEGPRRDSGRCHAVSAAGLGPGTCGPG